MSPEQLHRPWAARIVCPSAGTFGRVHCPRSPRTMYGARSLRLEIGRVIVSAAVASSSRRVMQRDELVTRLLLRMHERIAELAHLLSGREGASSLPALLLVDHELLEV